MSSINTRRLFRRLAALLALTVGVLWGQGSTPTRFNLDSFNDLKQISTPGTNPNSGYVRIYAKTASTVCVKTYLGVETCYGAGIGITTLNGLIAATQSFAIGTTGTAPNWASATSTHTLHIPMASTGGVTAGLLSNTDYAAFTAKQAAISVTTPITLAGGTSVGMVNIGTTTTVLHGNAAGNASFAGLSLANDTVANQGTTTTLLHGNAAGQPSFAAVVSADLNITTTSCTNQFVTAISSAAAGSCTTATLSGAQFANQGTTTAVLHGNAAGNPSWTGISLANDTAANQGTTTTVLHGNAAGQPSFGSVANGDLTNSAVSYNGQTGTLGSSYNVNNGAAQYSVAVNGAAGAAIQGAAVGAGQVLQGASGSNPTGTPTPALGTDNSIAGTLQMANGAANAHTIWASDATTTNTIAGFAVVPTTGHVVTCTVSGIRCTLTDGGAPGVGTVTVVGAGNLSSTALVTGGGTTTLQTPSATATMDGSGNISTPGSITVGSGSAVAGNVALKQGTLPALVANSFSLFSPTGITTGYGWSVPTGENGSAGLLHVGAASSHVSPFTISGIVSADITDGTITSADVAGPLKTGIKSIWIDTPVVADAGRVQVMFPTAITITRVACSTKLATSTVDLNMEVRAAATPDTAGTDVLSAELVCDTNQQTSCASGCDVNTITAGAVAARVPLAITPSAIANAPTDLRIFIEYTIDP